MVGRKNKWILRKVGERVGGKEKMGRLRWNERIIAREK